MAEAEGDMQHMTPDTVEEYFRNGVPSAFNISVRMRARLEIDPAHEELRLVCPASGGEPDVAAYERIKVERVNFLGEQGDWYELRVDATEMHYEAYVLIESIVDQLRSGVAFRNAVSESLASLKGLLTSRKKLTDEKVTGLIGELIVLGHVLRCAGEEAALAAWLGPLSEEHDFGFGDFDAEVKTTRSEGRSHQIGSETQLQPVPDRPLYLISVQITQAGGARDGFSLPELVFETRNLFDRTVRAFDSALDGLGWHDSDADLYRTRFHLRSQPRGYLVDDEFPAITSARLDDVIPQRTLVTGVSYRVDVTHLPHASVPMPLTEFCEGNA